MKIKQKTEVKILSKKIVSLLVVICIMAMSLIPVSAVTYPEGVTSADAALAAQKLDSVVLSMVKQNSGKTLGQTIYTTLYADDTLNQVLTGILSGFGEDSQLSSLGIDLSKENIARCLSEYPSVSKAVNEAPDLSHVDLKNAKWGVNSKQSLAAAIANIAEPFNDLLYFLLCSGSLNVSVLTLPGDNGYKNGIVPMLEGLTCKNLMDPASFKANADVRKNTMVENIAMMIFPLIDEIAELPVERLCEKIPQIAKFFNDGSFAEAMDGLLKPISIHVGDLITIVPATKMLSIVLWAQDSGKYSTDFTENMTTIINDAIDSFDFEVAEINLEEAAACVGNTGDAFLEIVGWLIDTIKLNTNKLPELLDIDQGGDIDIPGLMNKIFAKDTNELLGLIIKLFTAKEGTEIDYQWTQKPFTPGSVSYTTNLKEYEFGRVYDGIDSLIGEALADGGEFSSIKDAVRKTVYSNETLSSLVVGLYSALDNEEIRDVISMTGMSFSPSAVAGKLKESRYRYARNKLYNYRTWSALKDSTINFGIRTGRSDDFEDALVAVLRPFAPVFRMLFANESMEIMGAIQIPGSNGYNTAVIPLLEALGCDSEDILTYDKYKSQSEGDGAIEGIIHPVMGILENAESKPIATVISKVPNLLKFVSDGNLIQAVMNLLAPVENLLDEIGLTYADLGLNIEEIKNTDFLGEISKKLPEMIPDIKMDAPDLTALMNLGKEETRTSKATYQGQNYTYTYIVADNPAVMYTVMDFVIGLITKPENADMINNLMASGNDDAGMFSQYSGDIGSSLSEMSKEECLEWLYRLFFHERVTVETTESDYHPNITYVKDNSFKINYGALAVICFMLMLAAVFCISNRNKIASLARELNEKIKSRKENKEV